MGIREKTPEELKTQTERVQQEAVRFGRQLEIPEGSVLEREEWLREKYPQQYHYYRLLVAGAQRAGRAAPAEAVQRLERYARMAQSLDEYIARYEAEQSADPRHEMQLDVFKKIGLELARGTREGFIKLPTGAGKTVIFSRFVEALRGKSVIVVPTNELVKQTYERMAPALTLVDDRLKAEGGNGLTLGRVNEKFKDFDADCIITTYNSLIARVKSGDFKPDEIEYLILDEAHYGLGAESTETIEKFTDAVRLGFTATPKRSEEKQVGNLLTNELYSMGVKEAIEGGLLCGVSTAIVHTGIDLSSVPYDAKRGYDEKALNIDARNQAALMYYEARKKWRTGQGLPEEKSIVFTAGVNHAKDLAELFRKKGVAAEAISGEMPDEERKNIMKRFANRTTTMLLNDKLLREGFDDVQTSLCFLMRPTGDVIAVEQAAGRALRLDSDNPSKIAHIVNFLDEDSSAQTKTIQQPVLYGDVLEGMAVYQKKSEPSDRIKKDGTPKFKQPPMPLPPGLRVTMTESGFMEIKRDMILQKDVAPRGWEEVEVVLDRIERQLAVVSISENIGDPAIGTIGQLVSEQKIRAWLEDAIDKAATGGVPMSGSFKGALGGTKRFRIPRLFIAPELIARISDASILERGREHFENLHLAMLAMKEMAQDLDAQSSEARKLVRRIETHRTGLPADMKVGEKHLERLHEAVLNHEMRIQDIRNETARLCAVPEILKADDPMKQSNAGVSRAIAEELLTAERELTALRVQLDKVEIVQGWVGEADFLEMAEVFHLQPVHIKQAVNRLRRLPRWKGHTMRGRDGSIWYSRAFYEALTDAVVQANP